MQTKAGPGYDVDFVRWAESQAAALREGRFDDVDIANVSEEIESLARSDKRKLESRLATLMMHLLKREYQPAKASYSWQLTIVEQASQIIKLLKESPSLRRELWEFAQSAYPSARRKAAIETGLPITTFPEALDGDVDKALHIALKEASGS